MPGLWARSLDGGGREATNGFFLPVVFSSPLAKINKGFKKKVFRGASERSAGFEKEAAKLLVPGGNTERTKGPNLVRDPERGRVITIAIQRPPESGTELLTLHTLSTQSDPPSWARGPLRSWRPRGAAACWGHQQSSAVG